MALVHTQEQAFDFGAQRLELLAGLEADNPTINPKFFYDQAGSELFARICDLPEYYPTRTEVGILTSQSKQIAAAIGEVDAVIEPGAGNCEKIRHLLADLDPGTYIPVDISADYLQQAAEQLHVEFPQLAVMPVAADFSRDFELPDYSPREQRLLFYPGSTIGNFLPEQARSFLQRCTGIVGPGGGLLIGVDLHKDSNILNGAYNDVDGVTAAFNRNILHHANHILEANFEPGQFDHQAFYNEAQRRIEMHLVSTCDQVIEHGSGSLFFAEGDSIHTEYSHKYSRTDFADLAAQAGFVNRGYWSDEWEWFSVQYFEVT